MPANLMQSMRKSYVVTTKILVFAMGTFGLMCFICGWLSAQIFAKPGNKWRKK